MADMTRVGMRVRGAEVVTVPIDDTLTIEGQAADAKAVGDALAQKADKSELQAAIQVNGQPADAQGLILINGMDIPVSEEDQESIASAVTEMKGKTAENIPMSSDEGARTIADVVNETSEAVANMEGMTAETMPMAEGSQETVKGAIDTLNQKAVKTVNQKAPDAEGNVDLSVVPLAENLQSDKMQSVDGTFIIRTTGGSSSVSDGKAYPQHIMGTSERTGYVAEELNMTVIPIERTEPDEPITATIDRDVFVAYVDESGTINLYYTTEWSEDPELYGVTVEGTPVAGDQIQIVYVKEDRGTILVSNPGRLVGTGWNLFNFNAGYARVVRYSDEYGYKIGGAFTSIEYSATPEGDRVSILPGQNGLFQVPGDGYVFVSGGNATDTYILATWSDWTDGPATGYWEAYKESGIDLSAVMGTYFPYGMLSVGTIHDEIDLSAKRTISRVERLAYSVENLAAAIASGREYIYDTNYIYLVRAENVISAITIDTVYNVSEHGLEWFTGTTMPLITEILYGKNLRDKLERDVLTISQQTLAEEEKAQVRRNIGVMDPPTNGNGTMGQLLKTNGDGTTEWTTQGTPTDAQVGTAVSAWLTAHPEATTTVQDGAISRAKLDADLKAKTDAVPDLKSAIGASISPLINDSTFEGTGNLLDTNRCLTECDISVNGVISSNSNRAVSDYIPVNVGDVLKFYCLNNSSNVVTYAPYTIAAYDNKLVPISAKGDTSRPSSYTVPDGIRFVRISYYKTTISPMILRNVSSAPSAYVAYADQTAKDNDIQEMLQDILSLQNDAQSADSRLDIIETNIGDWYFEKAYTDAQRVFFQFNKVMSKAYFRILSSTGTINNLNIYVSADGWQTQTLLKMVPIVNSDDGIVTFDMTSTTPPATSVRFTFGFAETSTGTTKVIVHPIDGVSISDDIVDIETEIDSLRVPNTEVIGTNYNQYVLAGTGSSSSPYRVQPAGQVTNPTQYNVMQYAVTAGNVYVLSGFDVSLRVDAPMLGFGVNPAGASSVNLTEVMSNGNSTMTDYLLWYKPITDGYIFVAWITGRERVHLYSTVQIAEKYTKANNPFAIKIQLFGDSITDNKWGDKFTWSNLVGYNLQDYSVTVVNDAVGGSGIGHGKSTSTQSHQSEDYNFVYDLVTDGTTLQTDADYIVILAGTNNWKGNFPIGDMSSTGYETVYGALKGILEYISTHTKATVFVCTIPQRYNSDDQERPTNEYGEPLYNGKTLAEYCEPFRVVSAFYGMPCIHLNEDLGWNRINIDKFTVDGLHPNIHGDKMISAFICAEIRKHIGVVPY